ncbi:hypothetical protein PQH03_07000 [Ralstonia insidiosa]|uniref:Tail assembly protein n=1 Tax=Ralstonia insidiosa TaxID=190721 RepID=A0A848NV76_9RALS|nr:hypothetical protein [Ralstonia insidiosa]MDE4924373.1 hypothetical protein [Ralstonia insidiosa]NMV37249.1 hypothetical protein [Ralstonia insidiosa]UNJ99916.1 hypothetical protein MMB19_14440 [Ralstonia insidiosa]
MWISLVIMVVSYILSVALKPHPQDPPSATLQDVNVPTVDQGTPVPVVFGEVWVENWMVLWYGDLRVAPIKSGGKK